MPRSIAVIGASDTDGKVGNVIARNLISYAYDGEVFFVNPHREKILERRCYPSVLSIGQDVDCAIVVVPADAVYEAVRDASAFCRYFVVISAGFGETGFAGHNREMRLSALAQEKGLTILGPNCLGFVMPYLGLNASFAPGLPHKGRVALISQSGALAVAAMDRANGENFGFSAVVSIGNKMQIGVNELIDYFSRDHATDVIAIYVEGVDHGETFIHAIAVAQERGKHVVVLKSGRTQEGHKAIALHTGSLAGNEEIFRAALRKAGAVHADSLEEFFACMYMTVHRGIFDMAHDIHVGVVTNAGGLGVLATDAIASITGITMSHLAQNTKNSLKEHLPAAASVHNPVDILGDALADRYHHAITQLIADESVHVIYVLLTPQIQTPVEEVAKTIVALQKTTKKPIIASFVGGGRVAESVAYLIHSGVVHFTAIDHMAKTIACLRRHTHACITPQKKSDTARIKKVRRVIDRVGTVRRVLYFDEVATIARAYDLPISVSHDITKGLSAQQRIIYPCVAKVDSPAILHKTEQQGVILPIANLRELDRAQKHLRKQFTQKDVRIITQPLYPIKMELLVGMVRDPIFGVVIVVGLGGIYAEVLRQTDHMIAPLSMTEVKAILMHGTMAFLFRETRGQQPYDCESVAHVVIALAQMATECPEIAAIDINPFLLYNDDRCDTIVDMKIVLS